MTNNSVTERASTVILITDNIITAIRPILTTFADCQYTLTHTQSKNNRTNINQI